MIVETFRHALQPALDRRGVEDHLVAIGEPDRRKHIAYRVLEFAARRGRGEFRRGHHRAQDARDIAIRMEERLRHSVDHRLRRTVRHEVDGDLAGDMARGCRLRCENVERLLNLGIAAPGDVMAEEDLVAVVVAGGIELEQALPDELASKLGLQAWVLRRRIDADAGQDAGQFLHVFLGVAGANAHGVEFHDLARIVLVDVAHGVPRIVEIAEHGRVMQRRAEKIAETAERMRADRAVDIVADHGSDVRLGLMDVEVVEPEPCHALTQLRRRIQIAQDVACRGLPRKVVQRLLERLPRRALEIGIGDGVERPTLLRDVRDQRGHRPPRDSE